MDTAVPPFRSQAAPTTGYDGAGGWDQCAVPELIQLRMKRNVEALFSEIHWLGLHQQLRAEYQESDYEAAERSLEGGGWPVKRSVQSEFLA